MTDLKELLRTAAAEAGNVTVDGSALVPAIRRRRRVRSAAVATTGVAAATTLAITAYAVLPGAGASDAPVSGGPVKPLGGPMTANGELALRCGSSTPLKHRSGMPDLMITQSMMKESMTRYGNGWRGTLASKVTNTSTVTRYGANPPAHYLVVLENAKGNFVLGKAKATVGKDHSVLRPGESKWKQDVPFTVTSCNDKRMPSGWYLLYVDGRPATAPAGRVHL